MAKKFSLVFENGGNEQPKLESGNRNRFVASFIKLLRGWAGGANQESCSITGRIDGVCATGTVTCATVVNGNTVTINGTTLTAAQHHATGTVTIVIANTDVDDTVTINGVAFTAKNAESLASRQFDISGTATAAATSLAACINASTHVSIYGIVTATSAAGVVTIRYYAQGTAGNAITLASSDADGLAVSAATLTNGAAATNNEFCFTGSNTEVAASLVSNINASTTSLVSGHVVASSSGAVVTLTALQPGVSGNAITLASSGATLAVSGARLTGGTETKVKYTF